MNEAAVTITEAEGYLISAVLCSAGMNVHCIDHDGRPFFTDATGAQVIAAVMSLCSSPAGFMVEGLDKREWLMVSFECNDSLKGFSSPELGWATRP